jgi:hypothetical protein
MVVDPDNPTTFVLVLLLEALLLFLRTLNANIDDFTTFSISRLRYDLTTRKEIMRSSQVSISTYSLNVSSQQSTLNRGAFPNKHRQRTLVRMDIADWICSVSP